MSSPWVARVQVTASLPNEELNSSSRPAPENGWIATVMPLVCPCPPDSMIGGRGSGDLGEVVVAGAVLLRRVIAVAAVIVDCGFPYVVTGPL